MALATNPRPPAEAERAATALMAVFGLKLRFKVFQAKGSWYVAEYRTDGWRALPKAWPSEQAALAAVPRDAPFHGHLIDNNLPKK